MGAGSDSTDHASSRPWRLIYFLIMVLTVLLIAGLWFFSACFERPEASATSQPPVAAALTPGGPCT